MDEKTCHLVRPYNLFKIEVIVQIYQISELHTMYKSKLRNYSLTGWNLYTIILWKNMGHWKYKLHTFCTFEFRYSAIPLHQHSIINISLQQYIFKNIFIYKIMNSSVKISIKHYFGLFSIPVVNFDIGQHLSAAELCGGTFVLGYSFFRFVTKLTQPK